MFTACIHFCFYNYWLLFSCFFVCFFCVLLFGISLRPTLFYIYSLDLLLQNVEDKSTAFFSSRWVGTSKALHPHSLSWAVWSLLSLAGFLGNLPFTSLLYCVFTSLDSVSPFVEEHLQGDSRERGPWDWWFGWQNSRLKMISLRVLQVWSMVFWFPGLLLRGLMPFWIPFFCVWPAFLLLRIFTLYSCSKISQWCALVWFFSQ